MAAIVLMRRRRREGFIDRRIFRDRTNPLEVFDDQEVYKKFRFYRQDIFEIADEIEEDLQTLPRKGSLTTLLQVLITLRFYATGTFFDTVGEMIGVSESTASRTIKKVTNALAMHAREHIKMPTQQEADASKTAFFAIAGFPNCFACIDGTHIPIQAPSALQHEFRNRKNFTSINVQVRSTIISILTSWENRRL